MHFTSFAFIYSGQGGVSQSLGGGADAPGFFAFEDFFCAPNRELIGTAVDLAGST